MLMYPEVFKKLQDEVDSAVGRDRLPTLADRDDLPYANAVTLETFRWQTIAPLRSSLHSLFSSKPFLKISLYVLCTNLDLPHVVTEDDEYRGYRIPKGAIVFPNDWSVFLQVNVFFRYLL